MFMHEGFFFTIFDLTHFCYICKVSLSVLKGAHE